MQNDSDLRPGCDEDRGRFVCVTIFVFGVTALFLALTALVISKRYM